MPDPPHANFLHYSRISGKKQFHSTKTDTAPESAGPCSGFPGSHQPLKAEAEQSADLLCQIPLEAAAAEN
jgi:hypothetical protein